MRTGTATGAQIAVLLFAVLLLAVPLSSYISGALAVDESQRDLLGRLVAFLAGALLIVAIPPLRRAAAARLAEPIPASRRVEVLLACAARVPLMMAVSGAAALGIWLSEGAAALEARMHSDPMAEMARAFSPQGVVLFLVVGGIVAPVLEELVFRGFLFRAWEKRWGWIPAMLGVSTLFAAFHSHFANAFVASVLFVCLLRRTGSLWAPIVAHAVGNVALWYPLAGQWLRPSPERALGDIATWAPQLACLLFAAVALPLYVWMSREKPFPETLFLER